MTRSTPTDIRLLIYCWEPIPPTAPGTWCSCRGVLICSRDLYIVNVTSPFSTSKSHVITEFFWGTCINTWIWVNKNKCTVWWFTCTFSLNMYITRLIYSPHFFGFGWIVEESNAVQWLEQRDSGCLKGEVAVIAPSCSQLQTGQSTPEAQRPSSQ